MFSSLGNTRKRCTYPLTGRGLKRSFGNELQQREAAYRAEMYASTGHDWDQLILGFDRWDRPITLNREVLHGHSCIFGPSGSNKSLFAEVIKSQLIKQSRLELLRGGKPFSVLTIDFKPSHVPYVLDKHYAEHDDGDTPPLPFKWFDSKPTAPTHLFNPMVWKLYDTLTPAEKGRFHARALRFDTGKSLNDKFYSDQNRRAIRTMIRTTNPSSYAELAAYADMTFEQLADRLAIGEPDYETMRHAFTRVGEMAENLAILSSSKYPFGVEQNVLDNAIDMGDLLTTPQVGYFRLHANQDPANARVLGIYALAELFQAQSMIPKRDRVPLYLFIDESQILADEENLQHWLEMARSADIHICLISLTFALWPKEVQDLIINSTRMMVFLGAPDKTMADIVHHMSGTKKETRTTRSYTSNYRFDFLGYEEHTGFSDTITKTLHEVPGISPNELIQVGYEPHLGVMAVKRRVGRSRTKLSTGQAFVFKKVYPTTQEEHDRIEQLEMPQGPGTFIPTSLAPLCSAPQQIAVEEKKRITDQSKPRRKNGKKKSKRQNKTSSEDSLEAQLLREQLKQEEEEQE